MQMYICNIYYLYIYIIIIIIIRFRYKYLGNCRSIAACRDNYPYIYIYITTFVTQLAKPLYKQAVGRRCKPCQD